LICILNVKILLENPKKDTCTNKTIKSIMLNRSYVIKVLVFFVEGDLHLQFLFLEFEVISER